MTFYQPSTLNSLKKGSAQKQDTRYSRVLPGLRAAHHAGWQPAASPSEGRRFFAHTVLTVAQCKLDLCNLCNAFQLRMCEALLLKGCRTGEVEVSPGLFLCTQVGHMRWGAVWSMGNGGNCANQEGSFACLGGSGLGGLAR